MTFSDSDDSPSKVAIVVTGVVIVQDKQRWPGCLLFINYC